MSTWGIVPALHCPGRHLGMAYAHGYEILIMIVLDSGMLGCVSSHKREWAWKNHKGFRDVLIEIHKGRFRG